MLFASEMVDAILAGRKTVTRRRLTHRSGGLVRYRVGGTYAIQPGRGKPHVGHIYVTQVHTEELKDISPEQARCEGFSDIAGFMAYWLHLYGTWSPTERVAVIQFSLAPSCSRCKPWRIGEGYL